MFHVEYEPEALPPPEAVVVPLFVNLPTPIRTEQDLERAMVQEQAA